jgi:ribonucleotide monophosphatase NagD (HAD superfamily)
MPLPRLISGLSEIASGHDALICDVWGVVHDGTRHHPAAAEALYRFKEKHGPVVLLTNAPRVPAEVAAQCAKWEAGGRAEGVGKAGGMRCASASLQARII